MSVEIGPQDSEEGEAMDISSTTTETPDSPAIPIIDIVPHGDMILNLNSEVRFKVSSVVLCLASPVFRAMLGPNSNFKEACALRETRTEPYTLLLEDRYYNTFSVLLYVIHLQSDKVTRPLNAGTMRELAIICDKYDCSRAVKPWVPLWMKFRVNSYVDLLPEAWVFRINDVFTSATKCIILEGHYKALNEPFLVGDSRILHPLIPDSVAKRILAVRGSTVEAILKYAQALVLRYYAGAAPRCRYKTPSVECDIMTLGSIVKALQSSGIFPNYEKLWLKSTKELEKTLGGLKIYFLPISKPPCTPTQGNPYQCKLHELNISSCPGPNSHQETCDPLPEFSAGVKRIISGVRGLSLSDLESRQ